VDGFLDRELVDRKELVYPPFSRVALVRVDAHDEEEARGACLALAKVARQAEQAEPQGKGQVDILGPSPAPLARLRNRWRYRVMLRSPDRGRLRRVLAQVDRARADLPRAVRASVDVDPMQLL